MSIPKPQGLPDWATGPQAAISEPPALDRAKGWAFAQKPPHEWFNWWMNKVYQWVQYLDELDASGLEATYGGASSNVQAALSDLESRSGTLQQDVSTLYAWGTSFANSINAHSALADRMERAISGGVMVSGSPVPNSSAANITIPASGLSWSADSSSLAGGLEFGDLTINGTMIVQDIRTLFVLRVHGNLVLNGTLRFYAHRENPSPTFRLRARTLSPMFQWSTALLSGDVGSYGLPFGGAGLIGTGGSYTDSKSNLTTEHFDPTLTSAAPKGLFFEQRAALTQHLVRAGVAGSPMAAAPWLGGGGQTGGSGRSTTSGQVDGPRGGGAALVLVSGDLILGPNTGGGLSCSGEAPTGSNLHVGGGGGGGGALYVYVGGKISFTQGSAWKALQANGGPGGAATKTSSITTNYGGSGGGGGLVFLCARNADANLHCSAQGGAAGTYLGASSGNVGSAGTTVAIRAVPSMLL